MSPVAVNTKNQGVGLGQQQINFRSNQSDQGNIYAGNVLVTLCNEDERKEMVQASDLGGIDGLITRLLW